MLSVVGGTLVLGKRFQLLCHSDSGTLPIVYTLYGLNRLLETMVVRKLGEQAIFNYTTVYKSSDVNNFLCHAKNSQHRVNVTESGQLLRSTNIIGALDAAVVTAHSNKLTLTWSNIYFLCRACVETSVAYPSQHGGL